MKLKAEKASFLYALYMYALSGVWLPAAVAA
jgi:hypothetical protein